MQQLSICVKITLNVNDSEGFPDGLKQIFIFKEKISMTANQGLDYNVDLVMCIDGTGSMNPYIKTVKDNALTFYQKFNAKMIEKDKMVNQLRVKVIVFRDYGCDAQPMVESPFFTLSGGSDDESAAFQAFVNGIEACGGGDGPENALEALAIAMNSDWVRTGAVRRHIIHLYTDAPALPFQARAGKGGYPDDMPADLEELAEMWLGQGMEMKAKRLQIFAPDCEPWSTGFTDWKNTIVTHSAAGTGLSDLDISFCIDLLVNSIN